MSRDTIYEALLEFRCQHTQLDDSDGGMPLLDMLTPRGATSVALGFEELRALADHIAGALSDGVRGTYLLETIVRIAQDDGYDRDDRLQQIVALIEHGTAPAAGVALGVPPAEAAFRDVLENLAEKAMRSWAINPPSIDVLSEQMRQIEGVCRTVLAMYPRPAGVPGTYKDQQKGGA